MKVNAYKKCDVCGKVVAKKHGIFYHTEEDYLTIREDQRVPPWSETYTRKEKNHVCYICWLGINNALRTRLREEEPT